MTSRATIFISQTELNRNPSRATREVDRGNTVVITRRGVPQYDLSAHQRTRDDIRTQLVRSGRIIPAVDARRPLRTTHFRRPAGMGEMTVDDLLDEVSGDH